ncbi:MAG: hypothetical protein ABR987_09760 [Terracidiphilus sp.]
MAMLSRLGGQRRRRERAATLDLYATYSYLVSNSSGEFQTGQFPALRGLAA